MTTTQALTEKERDTFTNIQEAPNMALMRGVFHGHDAALIVSVWENEDGTFIVAPHAVLLGDEDFPFLTDSEGQPLVG